MSKYFSSDDAEKLFNEEDNNSNIKKEDNSSINVLNIIIQYINIIYDKIYENNKDVSELIINYENNKDEKLIDYFLNLELNTKVFFNTFGRMYLLIRKYIRIDNELNKFFNFYEDIKFVDYPINDNNLIIQYKKLEINIGKSTKKDIPDNWRNNLIKHSTIKEINDDFFVTFFQKNNNIDPEYKKVLESFEYKILDLICLTNILIRNDAAEYYKYELFVYLSKLLEDLKINKIKTNSIFDNIIENKINKYLLLDLEDCIKNLNDNISFNSMRLSQNYPQFIFLTRYDNLFNNKNIKPYRSQIQVIVNIILNNIKENFDICGTLTLLKTITGEGKTTLAIPLAILAKRLRHHPGTKFKNKKLEIIYCCNAKLKSNMVQVANNAKAINLPFAVAYIDNDKIYNKFIVGNNSTDKSSDFNNKKLLTIADIKSTVKLLEQANIKNNSIGNIMENKEIEYGKEYILFFDEPTSFLDSDDTDLDNDLHKLYSLIPANTILASATLPVEDLLLKLESYYLTKYNNRNYKLVVSENSQIGSEIYNFEGNIYLPNININDMNTYKKVINKIKSNLFLKKLYTPFTTSLLWNKLVTLNKKSKIDLKNIDNYKNKYSNPSKINQKNIQNTALEYLNKISSDNLVFFNKIEHTSFPVNLTDLRKLKNTFVSQTLIITKDPIDFINIHLRTEIDSLLNKINTKFNHKFNDISQFIDNISSFDITQLIIQNKEQNNNHIYNPSNINWTNIFRQNTDRITALLLGIGIYDPNIDDVSYLKEIIKLGTSGLLPYIISNTDIAYGTNFKIEYIIVDNSCFNPKDKPHSINTLFQLIARAGRRGISWKASIYCDSMVIDMIKNFCIKDALTIEDVKFDEIMKLLFKEYNVTLVDKPINDTLVDVLKEEPIQQFNDKDSKLNIVLGNKNLNNNTDRLKEEVNKDVKEEVNNNVKQELNNDVKEEVNNNVKEEVNKEIEYPDFISKNDIIQKLKKKNNYINITDNNYTDAISDLKKTIDKEKLDLKNIDELNNKLIELIIFRSNISHGGGDIFINPTLPKKSIKKNYYITK